MRQLRLLRAVECSNNLRGVNFKSHPSEIGQQQSNCCDHALPAVSVSERRRGNSGQDQRQTVVLTQFQKNNNTSNYNNSNMKQTLPIEEEEQQQRDESEILSTTTVNGVLLPEMPVAADHKFPLTCQLSRRDTQRDITRDIQRDITRDIQRDIHRDIPMDIQCEAPQQHQHATYSLLSNGKFPLLQFKSTRNFPLKDVLQPEASLHIRSRFPSRNMNQLLPQQRFPVFCQRPKGNFNYTIQSVHKMASPQPPLLQQIYKEFPTIKKQFVSFCNNQADACKRLAHGEPTDVQVATTTVTQTSHKMLTEIDIETTKKCVAVAVAVAATVDVDDVHKAPFDNELNAHVQTLNLNVEPEGVGERKEIEHQQAENFNDAFGRNKDAPGEGDDDDDGDGDAMNAAVAFFAKNKREICEQSRLEEIRAHNELNMTKERQSICLASEQRQRQTTIDEAAAVAAAAAAVVCHSDARESSPEQVDDQQRRQQIDTAVSTNVTQTESQPPQPPAASLASSSSSSSSLSLLSSRQPSVESSRCAVRELLDETSASCVADADLDLFDLLGDLLVQLITKSTRTGNFWSEQQEEQQEQEQGLASECVDMTVSKVSEDSEATVAVAIEASLEEQPIELDERNSSTTTPSLDMKYEVMRSSSSRLPDSMPSRLTSAAPAAATTTVASAPTSRIRNMDLPVSTTPTPRPLLGELKRNSSSRDDVSIDVDSLLPERTRLRRQRRMRSQESVEEKPEDVIERLNKLKARISGALSEVKGVLKQYSTESEAEAAGEKWLGPPTTTTTTTPTASAPSVPAPSESKPKETEPVQFRFVRKVRRRSYFDEADEDKEQLKDDGSAKDKEKEEGKLEEKETKVNKEEVKLEHNEKAIKAEGKVEEQRQSTAEKVEDQQDKEKVDKPATNVATKAPEKDKVQAKLEFLAKVQSELKSKSKTKETKVNKEEELKDAVSNEDVPKENVPKEKPDKESTVVEIKQKDATTENKQQQQLPVEAVETATAAAAPLPTAAESAQPTSEEVTSPAAATVSTVPPHPKKKIIIKAKNPRRASIAAVEPSKIVPEPVQLDVLIQRRPSDSEAIVKRKKKLKLTSVAVPTTSGSKRSAAKTATATSEAEQETTATSAAAAAAATAANEQLVAAEVNSKASVAKITEDDNDKKKQTAAATTAAIATATAAQATTTAEAAAAIEQLGQQKAPQHLSIDGVANRAAASEQSRRASLKLAELVGETVLVPAAAAATTATATTATATAATVGTEVPANSCESKEPINQSTGAATEAALQQVVAAAVVENIAATAAANADIEVAPVVVDDASAPQIAATLSQAPSDDSSPHQKQEEQQQDEQQQDHQQDQEKQQQQQDQHTVEATKDNAQEQPENSLAIMPELKVLTGPVQPVKIETVEQQPHDESEDPTIVASKKKTTHLKKLVRKSSIDKGKEKIGDQSSKLSNILKDKNKISDITDRISKQTPPKKQTKQAKEQKQQENVEVAATEAESEPQPESQPEPEPEPAPKPKKPRQIKKKVIIKRQKRRLSIGDTFFIQQEPEEPKVPEIETIEKAIAYVTDDEDEDLEPLPEPEPVKPLKSCLHVREYKIGDLILYAERYRKTQVRWKRGRILERITSISYKLEIEGKEVPAHISYIKKYTGRKVKFVGKEYLDIDYEQVVEEERRARSYSIWNMV